LVSLQTALASTSNRPCCMGDWRCDRGYLVLLLCKEEVKPFERCVGPNPASGIAIKAVNQVADIADPCY
jgi:hypothetical protein